MSSYSANKYIDLRTAAILTTSEVNCPDFLMNKTWGQRASLRIAFTLGSLTNVIIRYYASQDQVNYYPLETEGGGVVSHTLTADTKKVVLLATPGYAYLRVSAQGTGTVTSSSLSLRLHWTTRSI